MLIKALSLLYLVVELYVTSTDFELNSLEAIKDV